MMPVLGTQVASIASATTVDDDAENDESGTGKNLDDAEDELDYCSSAMAVY